MGGGLVAPPPTYLEEGEADVVLKGDAAYAPHITWLGPAQLCR